MMPGLVPQDAAAFTNGTDALFRNGTLVHACDQHGVTAIIDHTGKIVARAPQFERTVLRGEVQSHTGTTPYVRFGNTPILLLISLMLVLSYLGKRSFKR